MRSRFFQILGGLFLSVLFVNQASVQPQNLPVRGIHFGVPSPQDVPLCAEFIRQALPKEGVNTLVLEINYSFQYKSHPEVAESRALSAEDLQELVNACKEAKIELIPQINCLGHQSWAEHTGALLRAHPEFDETPGKYPENKDIYCRSYCPNHPEVHNFMFDLIDEVANLCEARAFHAGLDEVFLIGEDDCPRCKGKDKAELFAQEVNALHDHLKKSNRSLWIWGDRLIDGETTGIGKWEASENDTEGAINLISKDVVICDWHYDQAEPTAALFALTGFPVLSCPWRKPEVALGQLQMMKAIRGQANETTAVRAKGMLQTTWCGMENFVRAYNGDTSVENKSAVEAVECFKQLFAEIRK